MAAAVVSTMSAFSIQSMGPVRVLKLKFAGQGAPVFLHATSS